MTAGAIFCDPDRNVAEGLRQESGGRGDILVGFDRLRPALDASPEEHTVVLGPGVEPADAFAIADYMRVYRPSLGVILVRSEVTTPLLQEAMRAGIREVVHQRDGLGLRTAINQSAHLAAQLRESGSAQSPVPPTPARGRVITVFSAKGGCGKTTLATNVAAALADRGRRQVCLVDLDLAFGDVAIALQLFPARTIADAVPLHETLDTGAIRAMLTPHSPGLHALVAPVEPGAADTIPATLVTQILNLLREEFDYVVVDTPPAFDDQVLAAFDVSDAVALIVTLDVPALKNLKVTLEMLELLDYPAEKWKVVLNRADSKVGLNVSEVEKTLRTTIAAQLPSSRDVPAALNRGVPIVLDDPKHPVSVAIKSFADRELVHAGGSGARRPGEPRGDRRGLIRKRRSRE